MISIVVPVYRVEKCLVRCITSVLSLKYSDWELILVDDGSPDRSGEICDAFALKDSRIRVIHQENRGASSARNKGIREANGEYVCFIDADDYVGSNYLSDFEVEHEPDFAIQGMTSISPNGSNSLEFIPRETTIESLNGLLDETSIHVLLQGPCCKLFKTSLLKEKSVYFPIGLNYSEDCVFVLNYLRFSRGSIVIKAVSNYYYTHETGTSLSAKFHKGEELYNAVFAQYKQLTALSMSLEKLPICFESFYRKHLAIDFYQAVYNSWVDKDTRWNATVRLIINCNKDLWYFIKAEKQLPKVFSVLRIVCSIIKR